MRAGHDEFWRYKKGCSVVDGNELIIAIFPVYSQHSYRVINLIVLSFSGGLGSAISLLWVARNVAF